MIAASVARDAGRRDEPGRTPGTVATGGAAVTGGSVVGGALLGGIAGAAMGALTEEDDIDFGEPAWK